MRIVDYQVGVCVDKWRELHAIASSIEPDSVLHTNVAIWVLWYSSEVGTVPDVLDLVDVCLTVDSANLCNLIDSIRASVKPNGLTTHSSNKLIEDWGSSIRDTEVVASVILTTIDSSSDIVLIAIYEFLCRVGP